MEAYKVSEEFPGFQKLYNPAEVSILNDAVSRICQNDLSHGRDVDLLRFHSLIKVGCVPFMVRGKIDRLRKRLRRFPKLNDKAKFEEERNIELMFKACLDNGTLKTLFMITLKRFTRSCVQNTKR